MYADVPMGKTPVIVKGSATLRFRDVATVRYGAPDRTSLIAGQCGNVAAISVSQQVGANILAVRTGLEEAIDQIRAALPGGLYQRLEKRERR